MSRPTDGLGAYHAECAQIYLEKHCNEEVHSSTEQGTNDEKGKQHVKKNLL